MPTGKAASQVAHATFLALEKYFSVREIVSLRGEKSILTYPRNEIVDTWKTTGMCVIVLEVENFNRLRDVEKYCKDWKIIHHLYNDESEALKPTCLATGIIKDEDQWMFSKFKLHGETPERKRKARYTRY
jgi:peptidyl-tRNA hydrolase